MTASGIKVCLVEDSPPEREALATILRGTNGFDFLGAFSSAEEALEHIPQLRPDVILMDVHLPGMSGIECVRELKGRLNDGRIMMLTVFEDHDRIFQSLSAGASAYIVKKTSPSKLLSAIEELHQGGAPMSGQIARQVVEAFHGQPPPAADVSALSERESEILHLLAQGYLYKEIADQLSISVGTVRTHICRIYEKLHVRSRTQAINKVFRGRNAPTDHSQPRM
jgi:DNA-binding NarL/FixJ family response regulator